MFNDVQIGVGFQPKPQLTFRCTTINVKPRFMALSLFVAPSRRFVAKTRFCYNPHTVATSQLTHLPQMPNQVNNPQVFKRRC
jgi:hypothetical protein